ncbi:MAG: MBL fold metallo-hydrolase, partial [Phycisphaerales bacterium]
ILGYRFDHPSSPGPLPLAYCTDTSEIPEDTYPQLEGVETLVLDALRHRPHRTHFTVEQAIEAAERIAPSRTYLIHMTHDLLHAKEDSALPSGITLAYDGLVVSET